MNRKDAKILLERVQKEFSKDFHNIFTPFELCDEMLNKIPELNKDMKTLVMFNLEFLYVLQERWGKEGLKNVWFMTPCEIKKKVAIQMGVNENKVIRYEYNTKQIDRKDMPKFDVVVGNPPYKKNLHLKFLKLAVDILNKNGEIVWIHPARWLQDPTSIMKENSDFNKYKNLPFTDIKLIYNSDAQNLFNVALTSDLSISLLKQGEKSILSEDKIYKLRNIPISLKRLLYSKFTPLSQVIERNEFNGIRVKIINIQIFATKDGRDYIKNRYGIFHEKHAVPFIEGKYNNKHWTELVAKNQFSKPLGSSFPLSIKFNSIIEAQNFIDSTRTEIFQFFNYLTKLDVHIQLSYLPFMNDYTKPWTNERFKDYFNISDKEMKYIKEIMKKYI